MGTIEAEAVMFGQPIHIRLSSVIIGCRVIGQPHFMSTSIDIISALMKVWFVCFFLNIKIDFLSISVKLVLIINILNFLVQV
jgi:aconitase A